MIYARIYADSTGQSHFEDINVTLSETNFAPPAPPVKLSSFSPSAQYAFLSFPVDWHGDWHPSPRRLFFFFLSGEVAVKVGDGRVGPLDPCVAQKGSQAAAVEAGLGGHTAQVRECGEQI